MGMIMDMRRRKTKARHDDESYREKIRKARALIYDDKLAVNGKRIDNLLKDQSLVPTKVAK